jgi:phenylalanyl-tRNA synthetase alpha chain
MVHPVVLQNGGYDPARYSGFAWGMGPERQLMLRYKIDDIRYFWGNDLRFLESLKPITTKGHNTCTARKCR